VRLLTLTGPGGVGKTSLALELAGRSADQYPQGSWLVELAPLANPALVSQAVASTLGVREHRGEALLTTIGEHLGSRPVLLLLDNCEHVVEACAELVGTLVRSCPALRLIATSRERLGVAGETTWRVPGLAVP